MAAPQSIIGQTLSHYRVLEQIGAGGMGVVYRAHDERLDRDVALKVLPAGTLGDEVARKRFRKEALALAKLNHPNIATVFDFDTRGSTDFLITEYISGVTLEAKLSAGRLPEREVIDLGIQLAHGLAAAHEQRVVHRDIKPGNLLLTPEGRLKILDFGLAQLMPHASELGLTDTLTESQEVTGTLPYMAPERLSGERADECSDIWAAGAVIYEMATGRRAFAETQAPRLIDAILHQTPLPPRALNSKISPALEGVISKTLDKDSNRRYQSARELRVDLVRLTPASDVTRGSGYRPDSRIKRRAGTAMVAIAIVLVIGIMIGFLIREHVVRSMKVRQRVLAVLPFEAVGQDAGTDALGVGLTETVAAKLSQLSDTQALQLVPIREITAQGIKTADQARREFGTDLVIEGSLEQSGQFIRINCSLVDSRTQRQLSARTITTAAANIFDLQDRVVNEVFDILAIETRPDKRLPDTAPAAYEHYLRGRGYLQEYHKPENIESATREFNQAVQIDPNFALAYASLAQAYFQQANRSNDWVAKALTSCEKALSLAPQLPEAHSCLGNVYNGTGKYSESVEQFERALELDRSNEDVLFGLPEAYEKLGNNSAAEATYQRAIALRPHYWGVYSALGAFYYRQARYSDAADMFRQVIDVAPDNYKGYSNLGGVYVAEGKYSESIAALQRSIELRPNMDAYSNLGTAYFGLRRFAEAAENFKQGLQLDDHDWLSWGNLGDALYWTPRRREESQNAYRTAISLAHSKLDVNPRDATVLAFVGTYYAMLDEKQPAFENLHRALALAPADADVRFRAAIIYNHFGDTDQSLSWLEKAAAAGFSPTTIRDTPDFGQLQQNPRLRVLVEGATRKQ